MVPAGLVPARLLLLAVLLGASACTGEIGAGSGASPDPAETGGAPLPEATGGPAGPGPEASAVPSIDAGPSPLRRLTRFEYANTLVDLFGDDGGASSLFSVDQEAQGAGFATGGSVSSVDVSQLIDASDMVARNAVKRLAMLLPCGPIPTVAAQQDQCAQAFVTRFGRRTYRRPLSTAEEAGLLALYTRARTELRYEFPDAMRMVIQALLLSPAFNFRWELGPNAPIKEGALVRFNDHEIASRLSFFLWGSTPDDTLLDAADAGNLRTPRQVDVQARRLLASPRAKAMLADFHQQWLDVTSLPDQTKDPKLFPAHSPAVARTMLDETAAFASQVFGPAGDGKLDTLLTAPGMFGDASPRAGILTQRAFLASHAKASEPNPIKRGVHVAERLLCIELPVPPANIPDPRPPSPNLSGRERYAEHGRNECARSCHQIIDPLGFAFEHYDAVGAYRTTDGGKPVDASGTLDVGGATWRFANASELVRQLAKASQTRDCVTRQWFRYALRRRETPQDRSSLAAMNAVVESGGGDLRELLIAATQSPSFFYRQPAAEEVTQ